MAVMEVPDDEPYEAFARGHALHARGGQLAAAEAAYRIAIEGGYTDAWLNLGILLAGQPGRDAEEEEALRAAMACEDLAVSAWAAARLGALLEFARDDHDGARACLEWAERHGTGWVSFYATKELAALQAAAGDLEGARDRLRSFSVWFGHERDTDMTGALTEIPAVAGAWLAGNRRTRGPWRLLRRASFRAARRRTALIRSSERATTAVTWLHSSRERLAARFWAW